MVSFSPDPIEQAIIRQIILNPESDLTNIRKRQSVIETLVLELASA